MNDGRRTHKIASLIRAELARMLMEEISDPALAGLTITNVSLTGDFKNAHVFFSQSSAPVAKKVLQNGFKRATPFMRRKIGENLQLRFVPTLEFEQDTHGDQVERLYHILDDVGEHGAKPAESI